MAEEREVPFGGYPREEIQWRRGGPVAQRIRARGYEPRCRGFESLLAHSLPKGKGLYFPPEGRKTMIGIADVKLLNLEKYMKKKGGRKIFGFMVKEEKEENWGSVEFQVFSFTNKIRRLASHLELHKKDFSSERGLRRLLGKRQRLLAYLAKKNRNPIFLERVEGVGFISGEEAVNWGLSGPMLRASGIQWDLRKVDLYESYNQFDWKVQWQKEGDSLARYLVRIGEMRESIKIIQQAVEKIPGGPYENLEVRCFKKAKNSEWNDFEYRFLGKKPSPNFELSKQELYARVEAPKGELGIYLVGDDSLFPWRWKIRPPGFINLQILPQLVKKMKLADIMTILGSIDIIMGEVDH
uniref:Small ribosomal subunit protein uS15c n=3 Tax=Oryza sativa TaxID=4530 RepID=Q7G3E7_ORYSJ|nr:Putative NADH dehydrogenase 49kDa protein [Oryza sativa]AAM48278.1 Putative NADH dehydrogenase 49kDa protein [Oryza sativa Japonica Group]AAP53267.1 NAD, putative [Oryza sativa Japonica Group]